MSSPSLANEANEEDQLVSSHPSIWARILHQTRLALNAGGIGGNGTVANRDLNGA